MMTTQCTSEFDHLLPAMAHNTETAVTESLDLSNQHLHQLHLLPSLRAVTHLSIDYNNISCLPDDFTSFLPCLQFFSANGNDLSSLPEQLGSLTALKQVYLNENRLTQLPNSLQHLVNLRVFKLTGNKLISLPVDFGEMKSLEELSVEENELTRFPPTFALLTNLQRLEASHNKLKILPKYIGNLRSLTHLDLCNNQLEEIPESFGELGNLVCVDFSQNHLKALPCKCSAQASLKKFFAGQNLIDSFPEWLGRLPELSTLCLKENQLTGVCLPTDFGKVCKKLEHLDLCGNHLTELPESFGELESLEFLHLGSMLDELERKDWVNGNWLREVPTSFPQLHALTSLRLDENQIQFLPKDFGKLGNLVFLNIGQNLLYDLPESFGDLKKLRVCLLSRNNVQLLPSSFGSLSALEELRVDNNQLAELPESFQELTQLKVLDLFHNHLHEVPTCLPHLRHLQFLDLNQNPIHIPKKLIPNIAKSNQYASRDPKFKGTWRGRLRERMEEFVDITSNTIRGKESDDNEEVSEDVDELYGTEDVPYNFGALQRAAERSLWSQSTWRSHTGPKARPMYVRDVRSVQPAPVCGSLSEESDQKEELENTSEHSRTSGHSEEVWSSPSSATHSSHWESLPVSTLEENWDSKPRGAGVPSRVVDPSANWDSASPGHSIQSHVGELSEENWDEELSDPSAPCGYSAQDFCCVQRNGFAYNPKLRGFFFQPSDLHASATPRPNLKASGTSQPLCVEREINQFSDAEDS